MIGSKASGEPVSPGEIATESRITMTPGVCGGRARVRNTRIAVWLLVEWRNLGESDADLLEAYPTLTQPDLDAAWDYYHTHRAEVEQSIRENNEA